MAFHDSNCQLLSLVSVILGPSAQLWSCCVTGALLGGKFDFKFNPQPPAASHAHRLPMPRQTPSNPHKDTSQLTSPEDLVSPVCPHSHCLTPGSQEAKQVGVQHQPCPQSCAGVPGGQKKAAHFCPACLPQPFLSSRPSRAWTLADTGWRLSEGKAGEGASRTRAAYWPRVP